jgi:hypothetical protein
MRNQRSRRKADVADLQRLVDQLTWNNSETRRKFEQRIGRRRRVVVTPRVDETFSEFSGTVISFLPFDFVSVSDESGKVGTFRLAQVHEDQNYLYQPPMRQVATDTEIQSAARQVPKGASHQNLAELGGALDSVSTVEDPTLLPLVRAGKEWYFDTPEGQEEIRKMRLSTNKQSAIEVCHGYIQAQLQYWLKDRNGSGILQYAQRLMSTPGRKDGLYWETKPGAQPSPLSCSVAKAGLEIRRPKGKTADNQTSPAPFHGYFFKILTKQGRSAPGGKYDYVINGHMVGGFALLAYPEYWEYSGVMTFMVNQQDKIYGKNLGPKTTQLAQRMETYDPDTSWDPVE